MDNRSIHLISYTSLIFLATMVTMATIATVGASPMDVQVTDIFSDEKLCDATIHFNDPTDDVELVFEMLYSGDVVESRTVKLGSVSAGDTTKMILWENELQEKSYTANVSVYNSGKFLTRDSYQFTHNTVAMPRFKIVDFSADSSKSSILVSPGSVTNPGVADIDIKLFKGSDLVYSETTNNVAILATKIIDTNWPILLQSGSDYTAVARVHSHDPKITTAYMSRFTALEDVEIIDADIELDEYGASISMIGMSQVPFEGTVRIVLSGNGNPIVFEEDAEILTIDREDTVGIMWDGMPGGDYNVNVDILTSKGVVLDSYETIIRMPEPFVVEVEPEEKTPGFGIIGGLAILIVVGLFIRRT